MKFKVERCYRHTGEEFASWKGTGTPAFFCKIRVLDDGNDYELPCLFLGKELSHRIHYGTDSMSNLSIEGYLDSLEGKIILRVTDFEIGGSK